MKDFELAVSELIGYYRHRIDRAKVLDALRRQRILVGEDIGWQDPVMGQKHPDDDEETPDDPPVPEEEERDPHEGEEQIPADPYPAGEPVGPVVEPANPGPIPPAA